MSQRLGAPIAPRETAPQLSSVSTDGLGGALAELVYRRGGVPSAERPVLAFMLADGSEARRVLPAPLGRTLRVIVPVPETALSAAFAPSGSGATAQIVGLNPASGATRRALTSAPRAGLLAAAARLLRRPESAARQLNWALAGAARPSPAALAPVTSPGQLLVLLTGSVEDFPARYASLTAQSGVRWRGVLCDGGEAAPSMAAHDPRLTLTLADAAQGDAIILALGPGDRLAPYALAHVAAAFAASPDLQLVYGDETEAQRPVLKPGWSPVLFAAAPWLGRSAAYRASALRALGCSVDDLARHPEDVFARAAKRFAPDEVRHIPAALTHRLAAAPQRVRPAVAGDGPWPGITVIVPTRDRAEHLARCLDGLLRETEYPALEVLVVENGSRRPETHHVLGAASRDSRVRLTARPGPFDFSAMCNEAALRSFSPLLLFLNDDIAVRKPDWLKAMAIPAMRPDVGAVGARLLYPDGRIQHDGMALGLNGAVGHAHRGVMPDGPGYDAAPGLTREVSAVTGACLLIERRKFLEAGGFDADAFPIEYADADLCLRLAQRGYATLLEPQATLTHAESASRGRPGRLAPQRHEAERARFIARWGAAMAQERFMHPALSIYSEAPRYV